MKAVKINQKRKIRQSNLKHFVLNRTKTNIQSEFCDKIVSMKNQMRTKTNGVFPTFRSSSATHKAKKGANNASKSLDIDIIEQLKNDLSSLEESVVSSTTTSTPTTHTSKLEQRLQDRESNESNHTQVKMKGEPPKKGKRYSWSVDEKKYFLSMWSQFIPPTGCRSNRAKIKEFLLQFKVATVPHGKQLEKWIPGIQHGLYNAKVEKLKKSRNISYGRVLDSAFDMHLFRLVLVFRLKQIQLSNLNVKQLARKILALPKFKDSKAQQLKFSDSWLSRWKRRHHLAYRCSAKTHTTKVKAEVIDEWQSDIQHKVQTNSIPLFLIGNKDETPTKLNVSSSKTIDLTGTADVRYKDQGKLKEQFTTYAGGWAGSLKSAVELRNSQPAQLTVNDFTKDGHLMPSLSIFKGKTARVLTNVLIESSCFDPLYSTYLKVRPDDSPCPRNGLHGVPLAWKKFIHFHKVPESIQACLA